MLKYLFILLPVLFVVFVAAGGTALTLLLAQFWMVARTDGGSLRALFDKGGLSELCGEEIYFWTFLNLVIWLLVIVSTGAGGSERRNDTANKPGDVAEDALLTQLGPTYLAASLRS